MTLGKPLPSSGVSEPTKLSVSSMLSEEPSLPVYIPVEGGLSGDEYTGGLWLWVCRLTTIDCGRVKLPDGIVLGGGIPPLFMISCCWWPLVSLVVLLRDGRLSQRSRAMAAPVDGGLEVMQRLDSCPLLIDYDISLHWIPY